MDDWIRQFIIHNKILLTILGIMFTPVGLYAAVRAFRRPLPAQLPLEVEKRLSELESTVTSLSDEIGRLREENDYLSSLLERQARPLENPPPRRATTPV